MGPEGHEARSLLGKPTAGTKRKARPGRTRLRGLGGWQGRRPQPTRPGHPCSSGAWEESRVRPPHPGWIPSAPAPGLCPPPRGTVPLQAAFVSLNPHKKNDESELLTRAQEGLKLEEATDRTFTWEYGKKRASRAEHLRSAPDPPGGRRTGGGAAQ